MRIVDLSPENEKEYFMCLEEWSDEIKEAGDHKACWYASMKDRGARVKLAMSDQGVVAGMIQYVPAELSTIEGKGLYFVLCIWVHGHRKGRGNFQKQGMGKALMKAAEDDAKALGARGLAVWGVSLPFFMRASWFKKQGFRVADKNGIMVLLWKPFMDSAEPPKWTRPKRKPASIPGKVAVDCFHTGWCPVQNLAFERARRAAAELGDGVVLRSYDTIDRGTFLDWGISDAIFVDGKEIRTGPPLSYEKILGIIRKRLQKVR